jgi:hypothetical protein
MTKTQTFVRDIRRKRREITQLQSDLGNMLDHLAVVEARAKNVGKPTYSTNDVRVQLGLAPLSK